MLFILIFAPYFACAESYYPSTGIGYSDSPITLAKGVNEFFAYSNWICADQTRDSSIMGLSPKWLFRRLVLRSDQTKAARSLH